MQSKSAVRYTVLGILFAVLAIVFALLYYFNVISGMDLYLAVTYISYFAGLALFYNGAFTRESGRKTSTALNFIFGTILIIISTVLLIYGFCTGRISLF